MPSKEFLKKTKDTTFSTIDAALTLLDKYPKVDDTDVNISAHFSIRPFDMLLDLAKRIWGYDVMIDVISHIIVYGLVPLEAAIKTILITNIKNMLSCSVNPFISYDMINEGVVFDLRSIDIMGTLQKNPLDGAYKKTTRSIDKYYYFDNEKDTADDLRNSKDFNCFLWYVKNKEDDRAVWRGYWYQGEEADAPSGTDTKQTHKDGVMTLEFKERSGQLRTAEGSGLNLQVPYNNCLHVFIGNTERIDDNAQEPTGRLYSSDSILADFNRSIEQFRSLRSAIEDFISRMTSESPSAGLSAKTVAETEQSRLDLIIETLEQGSVSLSQACPDGFSFDSATGIITYTSDTLPSNVITISEDVYGTARSVAEEEKKSAYDSKSLYMKDSVYRDVEKNYYYHKPLLMFNTDYIMSIKLFDSKVVTAQLLDALTGVFSIDLNLTYQERLVRHEIARMVKEIIENDDTFVSDCFFSFSNEDYDRMLSDTEKERMGFPSVPNDPSAFGSLDAKTIVDALNGIAPDATPNEIQTNIRHLLESVSVSGGREISDYSTEFNANARFSFIENLMNTLAYVIVMSIMSPKVYLVLALNLRIMGQEHGVDMSRFIEDNKNLICSLIRGVRDMLMDMFFAKVKEYLAELAEEMASLMITEQFEYYRSLLKRCIDCFNSFRNTEGWSVGEVTADIGDGTDLSGAAPTDIEFNVEC